MTAVTLSSSSIRRINVRQDLLAVADLIELCFASTLDRDGREYLRHLRRTSGEMDYVSWLQGAAERIAAPLYGFVWEEAGRIVGNLSLIPLHRRGKFTYMIANVAVHPDYRGRGIGRQLTETALDHLREYNISTAWLQVRDDNPVAYHLYTSLGFVERARRTTWQSNTSAPSLVAATPGVTVQRRRAQDWTLQLDWLKRNYPPEVSWNLPISFPRLDPGIWNQAVRWLKGEVQEHWVARLGEQVIGFATWEPMRSSSDSLWLAAPAEHEEQAIIALLPRACGTIVRRSRPLQVNYPAGRGANAFQQAGFSNHQTLVWMSVSLGSLQSSGD